MYYIEGTIDAIDVFGSSIRFSLLPSNAHLMSRDEGKKTVLFVGCSTTDAITTEPKKNATGKEIVWFSADENLLSILLSAKTNRNTIRVWFEPTKTVDILLASPMSICSAIKAEGIRIF